MQISKVHFDPVIKDLILNQCQQQQQSHSLIDNSFAGITSGDCFQNITSDSIILSPQLTQTHHPLMGRKMFSNKVVRANNSANHFEF